MLSNAAEYFFRTGVQGKRLRATVRARSRSIGSSARSQARAPVVVVVLLLLSSLLLLFHYHHFICFLLKRAEGRRVCL